MKKYTAIAVAAFVLSIGYTLHAQGRWIAVDPVGTPTHYRSASFLSPDEGYTVGWTEYDNGSVQAQLARTVDGGQTWGIERFSDVELNAIYFSDRNNGIVAGRELSCNCPVILSTSDAGDNWSSRTFDELVGSFNALDFVSASVGVIGGGDPETGQGYVVRTDNGGESYRILMEEEGMHVSRLDLVTSATLFLAAGEIGGIDNRIYRCRNADASQSTASWELMEDFGEFSLINGIDFLDESTGYSVLTGVDPETFEFSGDIYKTTDAGESWDRIVTSSLFTLVSLDFIDADHGFSVGTEGAIVRTDDGGKTWHDTVTNTAQLLTWVLYTGPSVAYAVGTEGVVLKYESNISTVSSGEASGSHRHVLPVTSRSGERRMLIVDRGREALSGHSLVIVDPVGKIVAEYKLSAPGEKIDLGILRPGVYLYRMTEKGNVVESGSFQVW